MSKLENQLEEDHYSNLTWLEKAGEIFNITIDHTFDLVINGQRIGQYTIDFTYRSAKNGKLQADETKGYFHVINRLRFKIFLALHQEKFETIRVQDLEGNYYPVRLTETGRIQGLINNKWTAWKFTRPSKNKKQKKKQPKIRYNSRRR